MRPLNSNLICKHTKKMIIETILIGSCVVVALVVDIR